jgi:hypothetical protein
MFEKKQVEMSIEKAQGLFGELYTLTNIPLNKELNVSLDDVILGWGGGENLTKDFSFKDTWIEVKTRKSNTDKIRITRIEQLESSTKGFLSVVTVEIMSEIYNIKPSSIKELVQSILDSIQSPLIKSKFLEKLDLYGYDFLQEVVEKKFCIINLSIYTVDEKFPVFWDDGIICVFITYLSCGICYSYTPSRIGLYYFDIRYSESLKN